MQILNTFKWIHQLNNFMRDIFSTKTASWLFESIHCIFCLCVCQIVPSPELWTVSVVDDDYDDNNDMYINGKKNSLIGHPLTYDHHLSMFLHLLFIYYSVKLKNPHAPIVCCWIGKYLVYFLIAHIIYCCPPPHTLHCLL